VNELFASGRVLDGVIALLAVEVLALWRLLGPRRASLVAPTMLAGFGLMFAWRFSQAGASWSWVAVPLTLAGAAHAWDLWRVCRS
jgi:hypothetical protein